MFERRLSFFRLFFLQERGGASTTWRRGAGRRERGRGRDRGRGRGSGVTHTQTKTNTKTHTDTDVDKMAFQSAIKQFSMIGNLAVGFSAGAYLLSQSLFVGASEQTKLAAWA